MTIEFQPLNQTRCALGEGPVYDDRRNALFYCDITACAIHCCDLQTLETQSWMFPSEVGSFGLTESGRLIVALRHQVGYFDPADGSFVLLAEIEKDRTDKRLNDGKVGPDGAFWVGSMDNRGGSTLEPIGALYRVGADGTIEKKIDGLIVSNGLAFSPDGRTMFHSDSRGKWIERWDLDPATGALSNRRRIVDLDDATGRPDGGATDAEGCYWSAGISAQRLNRFSPDGKLLEFFPVPVAAPTMPCFGGPNLRTLYVTSLRVGRAPELLDRYPLTGIVVAGEAPVAGSPVTRFRDS